MPGTPAQHLSDGAIPRQDLSDEDLYRALRYLHETHSETFLNGSKDALEAQTARMLELGQEYLRRFPARPHSASRSEGGPVSADKAPSR